jgi:hypothetical protein
LDKLYHQEKEENPDSFMVLAIFAFPKGLDHVRLRNKLVTLAL